MSKPGLSLLYLIILALSCITDLHAKDYYLSNNGSDNAKGTSPEKAFKTFKKLKGLNLKPGDNIYLKAGDVFYGTWQISNSGNETKPITISSYGEGNKPVISGSVMITGFEKVESNIYAAPCEKSVKHLYENGRIKTIARYPNKGFLQVDGATAEYIIDADLHFSENQLNGVTAYAYPRVWVMKKSKVKSNSNNKIVFESPLAYYSSSGSVLSLETGANYYLDNKKEFLDAEGEWFYDEDEKKIYIYSEKPVTANSIFQGTFNENGIVISEGVTNIIIENLAISGQTKNAIIGLGNNKNILVQNNDLSMIGKYGVYFEKTGSNLSILNNHIHDITGNGIRTMHAQNSLFEGNRLERIGIVAGYGINGLNGATGICVVNKEGIYEDSTKLCHNNMIRNNYIEEIGYNGIRFEGYNSVIENNVVKNALLTMFDGGLIYCWARSGNFKYTFNNTIRNNLLISDLQNEPGAHKIRLGIYLDGSINKTTIDNNIIVKTRGGIMTNTGSVENVFKNNLIYGCESGLILNYSNKTANEPHTIINNRIVCLKNRGATLEKANHRGVKTGEVHSTKNIYVSPNEKFHIKKIIVDNERKTEYMYTLKGWQDESGVDQNSTHFVPERDGEKYPNSDIYINQESDTKRFSLNPKYEYIDLKGNALNGEINLDALDAMVVFYKAKQ